MKISLINRHHNHPLVLRDWKCTVKNLVSQIKQNPAWHPHFLIHDLSVVFTTDSHISRIHCDFLNDSSPTDIITFNYGEGVAEIFISIDTATQQAKQHHQSLSQELTLYLAHGLLHLCGLDDHSPWQIREMRLAERWLLKQIKNL